MGVSGASSRMSRCGTVALPVTQLRSATVATLAPGGA
jgi:hypothetical protein